MFIIYYKSVLNYFESKHEQTVLTISFKKHHYMCIIVLSKKNIINFSSFKVKFYIAVGTE